MSRHKINKKKSKYLFATSAGNMGVHPLNNSPLMRGGIRL